LRPAGVRLACVGSWESGEGDARSSRVGEAFGFHGPWAAGVGLKGTSGGGGWERGLLSEGKGASGTSGAAGADEAVGFRGNQTPNRTSAVGGTLRQSVSVGTKRRTGRALWAGRLRQSVSVETKRRTGRALWVARHGLCKSAGTTTQATRPDATRSPRPARLIQRGPPGRARARRAQFAPRLLPTLPFEPPAKRGRMFEHGGPVPAGGPAMTSAGSPPLAVRR
jgi:hypothetical protein